MNRFRTRKLERKRKSRLITLMQKRGMVDVQEEIMSIQGWNKKRNFVLSQSKGTRYGS